MPPLPLPSLEFRRIADISPSPLARAQISSGPILGLINRVCFDQMGAVLRYSKCTRQKVK